MRKNTLVAILMVLLLPITTLASDIGYNYGSYMPPSAKPNTLETVRQDANDFIKKVYSLPSIWWIIPFTQKDLHFPQTPTYILIFYFLFQF